MTRLEAGAATDVGRVRTNNEDNFLVADSLFAVADGMGGHAAGEVASLIAVETLKAAFDGDRSADGLADAARQANRAVWQRASEQTDLRGMGTTLTAAALVDAEGEEGGEQLVIAHIGDSRAYLLRDGELDQITDDHSLPAEMVRRGELAPEDAIDHPQKHIVTRALGIEPDVEADCVRVIPYAGDRVVLASDGLFDELSDDQIASILRRIADPEEAAKELVRAAKESGGRDNVTVVVVDVVDDGARAEAASAALADEPAPKARGRQEIGTDEPDAPARPASTPPPARRRRLTGRVIAFITVLVLLLVGTFGTIAWYARSTYYVGIAGDRVAIFKGRPDGLLWFDPTLEQRTDLPVDAVPPARKAQLERGKEEASLAAARRYVGNLKDEATTLNPPPIPVETTTTVVAPAPPPS
jgi:protein phosphatase